jgi:hypothetical protein
VKGVLFFVYGPTDDEGGFTNHDDLKVSTKDKRGEF